MTTITSRFIPLGGIAAVPHRSRLAACAEAMVGALAALLLGPSGVDAAVGFRRSLPRHRLGAVTPAVLRRLEKGPRVIVANRDATRGCLPVPAWAAV